MYQPYLDTQAEDLANQTMRSFPAMARSYAWSPDQSMLDILKGFDVAESKIQALMGGRGKRWGKRWGKLWGHGPSTGGGGTLPFAPQNRTLSPEESARRWREANTWQAQDDSFNTNIEKIRQALWAGKY